MISIPKVVFGQPSNFFDVAELYSREATPKYDYRSLLRFCRDTDRYYLLLIQSGNEAYNAMPEGEICWLDDAKDKHPELFDESIAAIEEKNL